MGKLQRASDGEMRKHVHLSSLGISPPTTSKDDASSSHEELDQYLNQINQDMITKKERGEHTSYSLVARKLQHFSCASDGETMRHDELSSLGISLPTRSQNDASPSHAGLNQSLNQIYQDMTTKEEKSEHSSSNLVARKLQCASCSSDGEMMKHGELPLLEISPPPTSKDADSSSCDDLNQFLNEINQDMTTKEEKNEYSSSVAVSKELQHTSCSFDGEMMKHGELFSLGISPPTTFKDDTSSSLEELSQSLNQINQDMTTKEEKSENSFSSFISSIMMPETIDLRAKIEIEPQQLVMSASESGSTSLAGEDVSYGGQTVKLPRPWNPLIDAVTASDKSKLRKVTERVRPEIHKVDERDSILEQIRTKSFNLKPALASRPSIRAPKTNLKVAAILEKAYAIG